MTQASSSADATGATGATGTVGVVFGGPSPEHDISILTGLQAARALAADGVDVCCLYWTKTATWLARSRRRRGAGLPRAGPGRRGRS